MGRSIIEVTPDGLNIELPREVFYLVICRQVTSQIIKCNWNRLESLTKFLLAAQIINTYTLVLLAYVSLFTLE